jgi:hypothetical protein
MGLAELIKIEHDPKNAINQGLNQASASLFSERKALQPHRQADLVFVR